MVKYNLQDIATVSGKGGLFKVVKPTRSGVIIESLDEQKKRMMIQTRHKISLLQEISIFTNDEEGSVPLDRVFTYIHNNYEKELQVNSESNEAELKDFIEEILPAYDEERVYTSDVKKIISWYEIINEYVPPTAKEEPTKEAKKKPGKETTK